MTNSNANRDNSQFIKDLSIINSIKSKIKLNVDQN